MRIKIKIGEWRGTGYVPLVCKENSFLAHKIKPMKDFCVEERHDNFCSNKVVVVASYRMFYMNLSLCLVRGSCTNDEK